MATEKLPLNKWNLGNNLRALYTRALIPRSFRRPYGEPTIARDEFFGSSTTPTNYTLSGEVGSYSVSGQTASFKVGRLLAGAAGSYSIAGGSGEFKVGRVLSGDSGTYLVVGNDGTFTVITGQTVEIFSGITLAGGMSPHATISRPNLILTSSGGGNFDVAKDYNTQDFKGDSVSKHTYLIDGEVP